MKKMMSEIELLKRMNENFEKRGSVDIYLNKLKEEKDYRYIKNIYHVEEYRALKSIYIDQNIPQAKQHFYVCGRLDLYLVNNHNTVRLPSKLVNAVLSDNEKVILGYSKLERLNEKEMGNSTFNAMHSILNNDMNALTHDIEISKTVIKRSRNFWVRFEELCKEYYEGILENDKQKVEEAIIQLVDSKFQKKRARKDIVNVLDFHGVGFAKLAWMRGIEVEVDSTLVPKELLPVKPNKEYTMPYNFLEDNFV